MILEMVMILGDSDYYGYSDNFGDKDDFESDEKSYDVEHSNYFGDNDFRRQ